GPRPDQHLLPYGGLGELGSCPPIEVRSHVGTGTELHTLSRAGHALDPPQSTSPTTSLGRSLTTSLKPLNRPDGTRERPSHPSARPARHQPRSESRNVHTGRQPG